MVKVKRVKNRARPVLKSRKPDRLYIAYGANLDKQAMAFRCPDAKPVGARKLNNAKLVFRGVADIAYEPGSKVPVAIWKISAADERNLDSFEGVGMGMYRKKWISIGDGKEALIYLMNDDGVHPPSRYYAETIRRGYVDFGLDQSYLDQAIAESFNKEPTEQTTWRRNRQKQNEHEKELVQFPESAAFEKQEIVQKRLANEGPLA